MKILEKYDGDKVYMFPSGGVGTREAVLEQFPAALTFTHVVETDVLGEVMFAFQNLSAMRTRYELDMLLTDDEAIAELQRLINMVPEVDTTPTAAERTAAALEFLAISALPTV